MNEKIQAAITDDKQFRKDLDMILQRIRDASQANDSPGHVEPLGFRASRERAVVKTKLQEAIMWLGMDLKAINDENPGAQPDPYPVSKLTADQLAQKLYEAYCESTGWKSAVTGAALPQWNDLVADTSKTAVVEGWKAAAKIHPALLHIEKTADGLKL